MNASCRPLRDDPEQLREDETADAGHRANHHESAEQHHWDRADRRSARENGHQEQESDDAQVLEEQDADHQPAVRCIELVPGAQLVQDDRRAREPDEEAHEQSDAPRLHGREQEDERDRRADDLQRAATEDGLPDSADLSE